MRIERSRPKATDSLNLVAQTGNGKLFNTGDDKIRVMQLNGNWHEMGQQCGNLARADMEPSIGAPFNPAGLHALPRAPA